MYTHYKSSSHVWELYAINALYINIYCSPLTCMTLSIEGICVCYLWYEMYVLHIPCHIQACDYTPCNQLIFFYKCISIEGEGQIRIYVLRV